MIPRLVFLVFAFVHTASSNIFLSSSVNTCLPPPDLNTPCTPIRSWSEFKEAIYSWSEPNAPLFLCPFAIEKKSRDQLILTKNIKVVCLESKKCKVDALNSGRSNIVRLRGRNAQLLMQGMVFEGSGTLFSAVHITATTPSKQIFCECDFLRNEGRIRGTALRVEPGGNVDLFNCFFEGNKAADIGSIFNRGTMLVEKCTFQNNVGTGGALGSSAKSLTILKDSIFIDNINGVPLFFHGQDYIDLGGNIAYNNDGCNGIYNFGVGNGGKCVSFVQHISPFPSSAPTQSPTNEAVIPLPSSNPVAAGAAATAGTTVAATTTSLPTVSTVIAESTMPSLKPTQRLRSDTLWPSYRSTTGDVYCERIVTQNESCIDIGGWNELKKIAENSPSGSTLIFCSFSIIKSNNDRYITITNHIALACHMRNKCKIQGPHNHIMIKGPLAQVFIQGFVFEDATLSSVRIAAQTTKPQTFCNCHFINNQGLGRGVGLLVERSTRAEIANCKFLNNKSKDMGGSIFNRGQMIVMNSIFVGNIGTGSGVACALGAHVDLKNNQFIDNVGGTPTFFHGFDYTDLGGNDATGNECNGIYNFKVKHCIYFSENNESHSLPPLPAQISGETRRGGLGYFNYDPNDNVYGPGKRIDHTNGFKYVDIGWGDIRKNPEHLRWEELFPTHRRNLSNVCAKPYVKRQSPIDLCEDKINAVCEEHHQTRTHEGNVKFGEQVTAQILPSKLRLKYYNDRPPKDGPYPPEGDFAHHWNGYSEVNHIDVKIPSEHTLCGRRYPAEYSVYMLNVKRRETIVMTVLMDFHPQDKKNSHFQKAIDQWQKTFDENKEKCERLRKRTLKENLELENDKKRSKRENNTKIKASLYHLANKTHIETPWEYMERMSEIYGEKISQEAHSIKKKNSSMHWENILNESPKELVSNSTAKALSDNISSRYLVDKTPFGRGGWDPFHPSLETSIYHWGYDGSLTEPPCSTFFAYRVLPAFISIEQWNQMRNILFNNKGNDCENTSVHFKGSVARPTQGLNGRPLYKCQRGDYVSDAEKERKRRETGNPNWCC